MPNDDGNKPSTGPSTGSGTDPSANQGPELSGDGNRHDSRVSQPEPDGAEPDHLSEDTGHSNDTGAASAEPQPDQPRRRRSVERALLEFLVCPERKTTLIYDPARDELISPTADLAYPIQDGVPILLEACARKLDDDDRRRHRIKI